MDSDSSPLRTLVYQSWGEEMPDSLNFQPQETELGEFPMSKNLIERKLEGEIT